MAYQPDMEFITQKSREFELQPPEAVLKWALNEYKKIAFACSFGAEDVVLVDMIFRLKPGTMVFYLDTELFFKETYDVRDRLLQKYAGMNFVCYKPTISLAEQETKYGGQLWRSNPDLCCQLRKIEPLKRALSGLEAWITGIRREQAPTRANAQPVEFDKKFNLIKINPLVRWTYKDVRRYIRENDVPYNVLHDRGYPSIGCEPCTSPISEGEDARSGRWRGFEKKECGLHY